MRWLACACGLGLCGLPATASAQYLETRVGALVIPTRQNLLNAQGLSHNTGTVSGGEFLLRNDAFGLYGKYLTGTVGTASARSDDGRLRLADLRVMIGAPIFSVEGGYGRRARSGSISDGADNLVRFGARSSVDLGPSGLSLSLSANAVGRSDSVPATSGASTSKKFGVVGWEAATAVLYQHHRAPVYIMLGYRYERIRSEKEYAPIRREELGGVQIGIGVRYLRPAKPRSKAQPQVP
jgi:hypothetical protein